MAAERSIGGIVIRLLSALAYLLASCLLRPFMRLTRFRVVPESLESLGLKPDVPLCYVLPIRSWIDWFALERLCRQLRLPKPHRTDAQLPAVGRAGAFYLPVLLATRQRPLSPAMQAAVNAPDYDVQLLPVALFWGRDPGQDTSLFRLLFADSPQAGAVRKFFIMLFNGRNVLAHFGRPLSYRTFVAQVADPATARRRLGRVLHFHFLHTRTATLGPTLLRRAVVIRALLETAEVRRAIAREASERRLSLARVQARARKLADEITADYSVSTLRVLERVLGWVWNRVFKGIETRGLERVRELARSHEIFYLPSHRSHADYLLLSYVLYRAGLVPPHIAAGINLNFWPVGRLLRRAGAFYIRRRFGGDALYTAVFRAYVDALIRRGYPISFYPEGGRSRTGRLLPPKTGLLAMVLASALRQQARRVAVVPVFIGYDKVWEVGSYFHELSGGAKTRESSAALLRAGRILRRSYGRAYISFGEPRVLQDDADIHLPEWRALLAPGADSRDPAFTEFVRRFAVEHMRRINTVAAVSPVSLSACALLATPRNAAAEDELLEQLDHLLALLDVWPRREQLLVPPGDARAQLDWAMPIARIRRVPHPWGDLLAVGGRDAVLMTYNRNNVQHLFALPSLIASLYRTRRGLSEDAVITACRAVYPFLRAELYLPWAPVDSEPMVRRCLQRMSERGLLERDDEGRLCRPEMTDARFGALIALAGVVAEPLERYAVAVLVLAREQRAGQALPAKRFVEDCRLLAERLALLTGREAPEFFDRQLFRVYLDTLIELGLAGRDARGDIETEPKIGRIAARSLDLLSDQTRQTLLHLFSRHAPAASSL